MPFRSEGLLRVATVLAAGAAGVLDEDATPQPPPNCESSCNSSCNNCSPSPFNLFTVEEIAQPCFDGSDGRGDGRFEPGDIDGRYDLSDDDDDDQHIEINCDTVEDVDMIVDEEPEAPNPEPPPCTPSGAQPNRSGRKRKKKRGAPNGNTSNWRGNNGQSSQPEIDLEEGSSRQRKYKLDKFMDVWCDWHDIAEQKGCSDAITVLSTLLSSKKVLGFDNDDGGAGKSGQQVLENLVQVCNNGAIKTKIENDALKNQGGMTRREALRLKLKTGMSYQGWQTKNQLEKRVRIDPGKKGVLEESKAVEEEAAMMMDLKDVIDMNLKDGELDVEGVVVSLVKAQLCLLADLEAKGFIDPKLLPSTIKWRISLDGTVLKNGTSVVVVGITPMNLNLSCQSSDCVAPIAFIRSGEDVDIIGEVLKEVMRNIKQQLDADVGLEYHGHRECIWMQSYDLASWWKLLHLSYNSNQGCCPFCRATNKNYHMVGPLHEDGEEVFPGWKTANLSSHPHPFADWLCIPMDQSCYCPLHAELRLFGDSFMDHLASIADDNGKLDEWILEVRRVLGSNGFNCEPNKQGVLETTALQGGQCKKFFERAGPRSGLNLDKVIDKTGATNTIKRRVEDTTVTSSQKSKMCLAFCKGGTRCRDNKMRGEELCVGHQKMKADGHHIKKSAPASCLTYEWVECDLHTKLIEIGEVMSRIFPAMQQNTPYYDQQCQVKFCAVGRWQAAERTVPFTLLEVPLHKKHKSNIVGWRAPLSADEITRGGTVRVKSNHPTKAFAGRIGKVTGIGNTKEQQLEILEKDLDTLTKDWGYLFTDERWTPYLHIVVSHTLPLIKKHLQLGQFSNSVIEAFHKKVRWVYAHTNRQGQGGQESSRAIMQQFWSLKILDIEAAGKYNSEMIGAIKSSRTPSCSCLGRKTHPCNWNYLDIST
jgi:hypothetical protein